LSLLTKLLPTIVWFETRASSYVKTQWEALPTPS
jgi:hypothetical protein